MPENKLKELKALSLPNIKVELCGTWIWITGDTKPVKEQLKELGCKWAPKKKKWFWRKPTDKKFWKKGELDMDAIRMKHGSEIQ